MQSNINNKSVLPEHYPGTGIVSHAMVHERAVELALINGRASHETSKSDWDQAKRELTGGADIDPKEALLESAPESERWDPLPGTEGHRTLPVPNDDQDDEGRSKSERLVEEGVQEAEHDQMLQSVLADPRKE